MLGHEHPANEKEAGLMAELTQGIDESPTEAVGIEQPGTTAKCWW